MGNRPVAESSHATENKGHKEQHIPDYELRPAIIAFEVSFGKIIGLGVSQASKQFTLQLLPGSPRTKDVPSRYRRG